MRIKWPPHLLAGQLPDDAVVVAPAAVEAVVSNGTLAAVQRAGGAGGHGPHRGAQASTSPLILSA